ncbi:YqgE/AlgH family protein [Buchnera aphidicola]|uniref:YqgE/AlgH family protein n=1 Tax=Buchnera aphidicola TaxID=9 RepID=UPI003464460B
MILQNHFLIAMPGIKNNRFKESVIYICEHNKHGAMGIIINKAIKNLTIKKILKKLNINTSTCLFGPRISDPVLMGGFHSEDRGFIIHSSKIEFSSSINISNDVFMTTSRDILESVGELEEPNNILVALGYCIWGKDQLEQEILNNFWLTALANKEILFDTPIKQKWAKAAENIGIDIKKISLNAGYA